MRIEITSNLSIDARDVSYEYSRSSGPGGQNVNNVNTRATLCFDLAHCRALSAEMKATVRAALRSRISDEGILRITSRRQRSRSANERAALERFVELLAAALAPRCPRVATRVPARARRDRLRDKQWRGTLQR